MGNNEKVSKVLLSAAGWEMWGFFFRSFHSSFIFSLSVFVL